MSSASASDVLWYHFKVLGNYNHTQYNSPNESGCTGSQQPFTYVTNMTCLQINCGTAQTSSNMAKSSWLTEVNENGSGFHSLLGMMGLEVQCTAKAPYRRTGQPCPACGGSLSANVHVARNAGNPDLPCNSTVYIDGVGVRTVKDAGGGLAMDQLDHYIGVTGCNQAGTFGRRKTIRLY